MAYATGPQTPYDSTKFDSEAETIEIGKDPRNIRNRRQSKEKQDRLRQFLESRNNMGSLNRSLNVSRNRRLTKDTAHSLRDSYSIALSLSQRTQPRLYERKLENEKLVSNTGMGKTF